MAEHCPSWQDTAPNGAVHVLSVLNGVIHVTLITVVNVLKTLVFSSTHGWSRVKTRAACV